MLYLQSVQERMVGKCGHCLPFPTGPTWLLGAVRSLVCPGCYNCTLSAASGELDLRRASERTRASSAVPVWASCSWGPRGVNRGSCMVPEHVPSVHQWPWGGDRG